MNDINKNDVKNKFISYVIPSIASLWVYTIYTMVDGVFVGRGVGPDALAAVNISMPFINLTFALGILLAVGASTRASIYLGQDDQEGVDRVFTTSVITVFITGLIVTVLVQLNIEGLAKLLGASDVTMDYVVTYLRTVVFFDVFFMTSYNMEVLVKADGFPKFGIKVTCIGALCNLILDYLLVIVFPLGVFGAAFATGLSQVLTFTIYLIHFLSKRSHMNFVKIKIKLTTIIHLAKLGAADAMTELSVGIVIFLFNNALLKVSGDEAVVVYTVIAYTSQLVLMTIMGLNQGMQPLISYYHGQNERETYQYIFKMAIRWALACSVIAFLICFIYPNPIVGAFIDKSKDIDIYMHSIRAFRMYAFSFLPMGLVVIFGGYFTAREEPLCALGISMGRGLVWISLSLIIMAIAFGENGIWLATTVSESLALITAIAMYVKKNQT